MRLTRAESASQLRAWGGSRAPSVGCVCVPTPPGRELESARGRSRNWPRRDNAGRRREKKKMKREIKQINILRYDCF